MRVLFVFRTFEGKKSNLPYKFIWNDLLCHSCCHSCFRNLVLWIKHPVFDPQIGFFSIFRNGTTIFWPEFIIFTIKFFHQFQFQNSLANSLDTRSRHNGELKVCFLGNVWQARRIIQKIFDTHTMVVMLYKFLKLLLPTEN